MSYDHTPRTRVNHPLEYHKPRAIALKLTRANHVDPALLISGALVCAAVLFALLLF